MGRSSSVVGTILALWAILVVPGECHAPFFIFGDSLLDAGNNQYLNNSHKSALPYGETFFKRPTGRVCDGRIVPDFLAEFANLPLIKPYLEPRFSNYTDGANFASAGAGILPETSPGLLHLKLQLSYFEEMQKKLKQQEGEQKAQELLSKAVYLLSMGGNDYMHAAMPSFGKSTPPLLTASYKKQYMVVVLSNLTSVVKKVYAMGGRKFIFQTVGPLGCMPSNRIGSGSKGCAHDVTVLAKTHNIALSKVLQKLEKTLTGFRYALFDYYSALEEMTTYPSRFGFKEGQTACCGSGDFNRELTCGKNGTTAYNLCSDPSQYVWFDSAHPTESANKHLASLFWSGPLKVVWPYNAKALFQMP
ncbi:GDSL esterase/lipase 4-like [Punica granatum]|uniref:GDSL esterase/lipase 4-like n=1 Tax=Punica granatum TaxID=22663 RepID=A0A218W7W6_PUNGR|nr:GDSL esterase/lipase 4-like [Punica granatum]OWM68410.1 hypothetical protein CDL15_Pgr004892 [Punica granatum]